MTTAERMKKRLASTLPHEQGLPCRTCGVTALACQYRFVVLDEWCCAACRENGARVAHNGDER